MNLTHHPSDSWLVDYATGATTRLFDTVLRAHIGNCTSCRETVRFAERLGGEMLGHVPGQDGKLNPGAICDHFEQVDEDPMKTSRAEDEIAGDLETAVGTYLNSSIDALPWKRIGNGLALCKLAEERGERMWMLRGRAGAVLPEHTHLGSELTLVLKGAYFCGSDIYRAGDIEDADETSEHQPVITRDGECICLAVTEGRLRFKTWAPRLLQPFVGI